jgi:hypothetical protein
MLSLAARTSLASDLSAEGPACSLHELREQCANDSPAHRERAVDACRRALSREGAALDDHRRYTARLLAKPGALEKVEIDALERAAGHLDQEREPQVAAELRCDLAVRLEDRARLEACTAVLARLSPRAARTLSYQWALAVQRADIGESERLLAELEHSAISAASLAEMKRVQSLLRSAWHRYVLPLAAAAVLAAVALLIQRSASTRFAALKPHMP